MECENCKLPHSGEYGSGRFCTAGCARQFSSRIKRKEVNEKVSKALLGRKMSPDKIRYGYTHTADARKKQSESSTKAHRKRIELLPFEEKSNIEKRRDILFEQTNTCLFCKLGEWLGRPLILELDHINGDRSDESRGNLRLLCPNCHSTTPTYKFKGRSHSVETREKIREARRQPVNNERFT